MEIQHRLNQQRVKHIVDSYLLAGEDALLFESYLADLMHQYPPGLLELALVETLIHNWLKIPMEKGVPFLVTAHNRLKQWQQSGKQPTVTPSQFSQITGLDPQLAFNELTAPPVLENSRGLPTQATAD